MDNKEHINFLNDVNGKFQYRIGTYLKKKKGSSWHGRVVGFYQTDQTVEGYCLESIFEKGSVQLYPAEALELMEDTE